MTRSFLHHLRLASRSLSRRPRQAVVAVLALAVGIGIPLTMYSVIRGLYLRGLPFPEADRLVQLDRAQLDEGVERLPVSAREFLHLRQRQRSFAELGAWYAVGGTVTGGNLGAERYTFAHSSTNLLRVLSVQPALGRWFGEGADTGAAPAEVLISDALWRDRFAADGAVIGATLRLDGQPLTVIGVMPPGFAFPLSQDLWLPLTLDPSRSERRNLQLVARLRPGVELATARAELSVLADQLAAAYPETNAGVTVGVRPYVEAYSDPELRLYLERLSIVVLGVFLLACANVANLLLARAFTRERDTAIQSALGAPRSTLVAQLLAESLVLAIGGGAVALALTLYATGPIQRLVRPILRSFWIDVRVDLAVVAAGIGLAFLASVLAGLLPLWRATRPSVRLLLNEETAGAASRRLTRLGSVLATLQIAIAAALLLPMALMVKSVVELETVDFAFRTDHLLLAHLSPPASTYPDGDATSRLFAEIEQRLRDSPGILDVALASSTPDGRQWQEAVGVAGATAYRRGAQPVANWVAVSPEFFRTLNLTIASGRSFSAGDVASSLPVAVVSRSLARRLGGSADPTGRQIRYEAADENGAWRTIVGVVEDPFPTAMLPAARGLLPSAHRSQSSVIEFAFVPLAQEPFPFVTVAIRTAGEPLSSAPALRRAVASVDPELPALFVRTMRESLAKSTWDLRFFSSVFLALGLSALLLALAGLYSVLRQMTVRRRRELGVRMALGATPSDNLRLSVTSGMAHVVTGLASGLGLGILLARLVAGQLFGVAAWDPNVLFVLAAALLLAGGAACTASVWGVLWLDPVVALREP